MQSHNTDDGNGKSTEADAAVETAAPAHAAPHHVPTGYAPRTGWKLGLVVVLIIVGLGGGFLFVEHRRTQAVDLLDAQTAAAAAQPPMVEVVSVKYAPAGDLLTLPGQTSAWYESTIYARVSGYVNKWFVDIGDHVKAGQVLATIDTPELDDQLAAARAKLMASQAGVNVMEANTAFAKSTYKRWWESPKGVVSEQEREEKKAEFDSSVAKLNAAKAQVNLDQANVDSLLALTAFKKVQAPFDGIITKRKIDIGDLVTAGSTASTTSLFNIAQADQIRVFVDVPQNASVGMASGTPAVVSASEYPDRKFSGAVARTARAIDPVSRTLRVEVDIPNTDQALMPGMYVEVSFNLMHKSLPQVPASALLFRSSGTQVAVVDGDGKVTFRNVTIARDQGEMIEIGSGLAANDKVALNIGSEIADGDHVTVVDADATASPGASAKSAPEPEAAAAAR